VARGSITFNDEDKTRVPDALTEAAVLLMDLKRRGIIEALGERVRIRRQGGYCGLDVVILLLVFLAAAPKEGLRLFWEKHRAHLLRLGTVAGRRQLPSPASVSRALASVEPALLREDGTADWLLAGAPQIDEMLSHPCMKTYDAKGDGWQVFHLDPTVETLRHRALPDDKELPEPHRRSSETGAPGYSGRKRGDVQFRRITVQHASTGAWLHAHLSHGNGDVLGDFELGLDTIVATCTRIGQPLERAVVVMDGEYGNVPAYAACRARALPFVTRVNRPKLYVDAVVLERLYLATWHRVPLSGCAPHRAAADLGVMTIDAGARTRRADGSRYEPITVRIVASIFPKEGKAKRGVTLDGWQVELFAVDLPADAFPAADVVALYFGRTALENRFMQDDRELGLDRILSYHLPGQELATLVGLALWNMRLVRGFDRDPPPAEAPRQLPRRPVVDERVPPTWPRDPVLRVVLAGLDWPALLVKHPTWSFDVVTSELHCQDNRPLLLTTVTPDNPSTGRAAIVFRRPTGGCEDCPSRALCFDSGRVNASKQIAFPVSIDVAAKIRARRALIRSPVPTTVIVPILGPPGLLAVHDSLFLPAAARKLFTALFAHATIHVDAVQTTPMPRLRLVAANVAGRQHRRKTWAENVARYALDDSQAPDIKIAGSKELRAFLGGPGSPRRAAGGAR